MIIYAKDIQTQIYLQQLGQNQETAYSIEISKHTPFYFTLVDNILHLYQKETNTQLNVNFLTPSIQSKINLNKQKPELVKAIEGRKSQPLKILDMTIGLGSDAITLAARGHHII